MVSVLLIWFCISVINKRLAHEKVIDDKKHNILWWDENIRKWISFHEKISWWEQQNKMILKKYAVVVGVIIVYAVLIALFFKVQFDCELQACQAYEELHFILHFTRKFSYPSYWFWFENFSMFYIFSFHNIVHIFGSDHSRLCIYQWTKRNSERQKCFVSLDITADNFHFIFFKLSRLGSRRYTTE